MKIILLAAAALIASPALAQTSGSASTSSSTGTATDAGTQTGTQGSADAQPTSTMQSNQQPSSSMPMPSAQSGSMPMASGSDPVGGYQPATPQAPIPAGVTATFQPAMSPDQAYPAPAPLAKYPVCKKGQYDKCIQRGGK